jgi:hypothetical protein
VKAEHIIIINHHGMSHSHAAPRRPQARGHSHGRVLRSIADRLLNVACAILKTGTTFNPSLATEKVPC